MITQPFSATNPRFFHILSKHSRNALNCHFLILRGYKMSVIVLLFLLFSIFCAVLTGSVSALSGALLNGAAEGVQLAITLAGPLCLWCGISHLMEKTGISSYLSRLFSPLLGRLFPHTWENTPAREALCGNFSANLLGLGSAATPLGIRAACLMAEGCHGRASDELCKLIIINTASIQLIPSTVAAVRAGLGASAPFDILPAVWVTSLCSVACGLLAAKVLRKWC